MGFLESLQDAVNKGVEVSKDLLAKASDKAQEMGEKGYLHYELLQLTNQAQSQAARIGTWIYQKTRVEKGTVNQEDPTLKVMLDELQRLQGEIDLRHRKLSDLK